MEKKSILIITTGWFPEGDAGAVRLSMIGRVLAESDYNINVLCRGKLNETGYYKGIYYKSLRNIPGGTIQKAIDYSLFPIKAKKFLNGHKNDLYAVYLYNAHLRLFKYCKHFCKKHNIKLFHDCVEWYSPEEFKKGEKSRAYRVKNEINTEIIDKQFSVIAISRYLESYFKAKGIQTIRVPILCDTSNSIEPKSSQNNDVLTIFYGGLPGTKDLVENLLRAILLLDAKEKEKLKVVFCGATREYLINISHVPAEIVDGCEDILELCGRVQRSIVLEKMGSADFAFLARDAELRYAQAGFPSKVVEALSNATPMLCNISSDLGDYLEDGKNAIIASSHAPEDIKVAIQRALRLTSEERKQMSAEALKLAKEKFDYRIYKERISKFFDGQV